MKNPFASIIDGLRLLLSFIALALCFTALGDDVWEDGVGYRLIELKVDTLPNLNISRSGHVTLCLDGELTVLGGHTNGFVPTATAEYLRDGVWHTVPLVYPHDHGTPLLLRSGKVFLAGGHKEDLGIGQLFSVELYDPASHTSKGFGCMDRKRAYANAIEMDDDQVVIAGNWYADDGIEMFVNINDPLRPNADGVKDVSFPRSTPYILRISDDDAIIFSSLDNKSGPVDYSIVDRLKCPSYREPFLDTWRPIRTINILRSTNHFIGNEAESRYEWLLPVENDETGQVAIARVTGIGDDVPNATFSLLPTHHPIPDSINGKHIIYSSLVCDRERGIAYLLGDDEDARIFVVAIPYTSGDVSPDGSHASWEPLTIYMSEPQSIMANSCTPALTPEGDIVFAGGHLNNNFSPTNTVIRLRLGDANDSVADLSASQVDNAGRGKWVWIIILCLIACIVIAVIMVRRKSRNSTQLSVCQPEAHEVTDAPPVIGETENPEVIELIGEDEKVEEIEETKSDQNLPKDNTLTDLFKRIERLMEDERLYLNANLRASDVAARVGSNIAYVSAAINSQGGCSFSQFIAAYRISFAQQLMREDPEKKILTIITESGFTTDSTFFRAFRSVTGMSPKEWLSANADTDHT